MRGFPWASVFREDVADAEKVFSTPWQFNDLYWEVRSFTISYPAIWAASGRVGWPHKNISDGLFDSNHWLSDGLSPHLARDILSSFDVGRSEHSIQTVSSPASGANEFGAISFAHLSPSVTTDKDDYAPGDTAVITATGLPEGTTVFFEVEHVAGPGDDGVIGTVDDETVDLGGGGHDPWAVTDGGTDDLDGAVNGSITTTWYVNPDDSAGATFLLTATDPGPDGELDRGQDSVLATTSFTDATSFTEKTLTRADGQAIPNITHMEFGPDGLLYASSLTGTIYAFDISKTADGEYVATVVHEIDLLSQIPNHDDDGTPSTVDGRFVLGFDVVGTATNPIIYVTSNDPRIDEAVSDTNSGILSMLEQDASGTWEKVDLVRGLPRSQHDHLLNGVEYSVDEFGNPFLLVSTGGNTNAGAPSDPLQYLPEYVLSGAVLKVDLNEITAMSLKTDVYGFDYYYNLPTLDDPTRDGVNEGVDPSIEIFGGNRGLNQAIYDPNGPITFYSTGLRNATEVLETANGDFLTFDNGGNPSWGGTVVFSTDSDGNTIATNLPEEGDQPTNNLDQLHLLMPGGTFGAYLGHPNPFRASGSDAGLYETDGTGTPLPQLPSDFDMVIPAELEDINQAFFLEEGTEDGALALSSKSTNGLAEYTYSGAFDGAIVGNIFAVRYGTQSLIRIELTDTNGDGIPDSGVVAEEYALGVGGPLDVLAPTINDPFFGTLFVSGLVSNGSIRILEPSDGSADINLTDRDDDGVHDAIDAYQYDPSNGQNTVLGSGQTLFWDFESTTLEEDLPGGTAGFRVGITGFMTNGSDLPEALSLDRFDPVAEGGDDVVLGGTANTILIGATPDGTAEGSVNNQYHGFQAGFVPQADSFTMTAEVWNPFRSIPVEERSEEQKTGAALTAGNQDSFLALMIGKGYIELVYEEGGVEAARIRHTNASLENVDLSTYLTDLIFDVDVASGQVVARYEAQTLDGLVVGEFAPIQLHGELLDALQGDHRIGGASSAMGWALLSTSGSAEPFESNWGSVTLEGTTPAAATGSTQVAVSGDSTFTSGAFQVTNTGSTDITRLVFTIDDTFVGDIFWDSDGTGDAGDPKPFTVDSDGGTGVTNSSGVTVNPLPGGGYATLIIDFPDFNPGETMTFSIDVDPRSAAGFGSGSPQGAISGLEMAGTVVTAFFADGTSATGDLVGTGINTSVANVFAGLAPEVQLTLAGLSNGQSGFVSDPQQTLELRGDPNARVAVLIGAGDTLPDDSSGDGLLFPPEFNSIEGLEIRYVTLDATGFATTTIDIVDPDPDDPNDGVVKVMAAVVDQNDQPMGRMGSGIAVALGTDGQNFDPVALNDSASLFANEVETGNVLDNDSDSNGDPLTVSKVNGSSANVGATLTLASGALLTVNEGGAFTYDPNGQFNGLGAGESTTETFTYEVADGKGGTDTATVTLTINGPLGTLVSAVNVGGGAYTAVETGIEYAADPGILSGDITYRDKSGSEIFGTESDPLYQSYGFGDFEYAFAVADGDYVVQIELIEPWWTAAGERLFDVALEGLVPSAFDNIDVVSLAGGQWQALTLTSAAVSVTDGALNVDFNTLVDNSIVSAMAIYAVEDSGADFVANDSATVDEDQSVLIDVLANDDPGVTLDSVGAPSNGSAVIEDGQVRYTPNPDFNGSDSFDYVGIDDTGTTATATVTVDVAPVNDDPENLALSGDGTVSEDATAGTVIGDLSAFDPDGDTIFFEVDDARFDVNGSNQLVVADGADLSVDQDTDVPITVTATDGNGGSATLNETVTILDEPDTGSNVVAAINVGGGAYAAVETGINYAADPGILSGDITYRDKSGSEVFGTEDDPLYQSYGFGDFEYAFAVADGDYVVQLELVEPWWQEAGERLFDVALEGLVPSAFDNIDVVSLAGGQWQALTLTSAAVSVTDGALNVDFNTLVNNSIVSAITVFQAEDTLV